MATSMCKFCLGRLSPFHAALRQTTRFKTVPSIATYSTETDSEEHVVIRETESEVEDENIINKLRNVSRLKGNLYRRNKNKIPSILNDYQLGLKYQRRLYGKFGSKSQLDPRQCWPSRSELREEIEFEREFDPTLQIMIEKMQKRRQKYLDYLAKREETVSKNMEKMPAWIEEFERKQEKVHEERRKQEEKKARLLQEAQEYFGYKVDPRDAKFKEMMELKAKEDKKIAKKQKKENRDAKFKARLQVLAQESQESQETPKS